MSVRVAFYWLSKYVVGAILRIAFRLRCVGGENVPMAGPVILACNHISYLDPPAIGVASPRAVSYMAKRELFAIPLLGPLIRLLFAFPVDRSRGDMAAMKQALAVLKTGACLGVFPEGTRNPEAARMEPGLGVAFLAAKSGAAVVPTFISGAADAKRFARITVAFGEPLRIDDDRKASRDDLAKWSGVLMERIYQLRETN